MRTLLLTILLLFSANLYSNGIAVASRGAVYVNDSFIEQGTIVKEGDRVITGDRSFVVLQFEDGAKVTVRPNSELYIAKYEYVGDDSGAELDLVTGGLRIITGALAKNDPENYKVKTPVALMGVRGTEFSIQLLD